MNYFYSIWGFTAWTFSLIAVPVYAQFAEIEREIADFDRQIHQARELSQLKGKNRGPIEDEANKNQAVIAELERRLAPINIALEGLKLSTQKAKHLLDIALSNPGLVEDQRLEVLHQDYRTATVLQNQKENEAIPLTKELDEDRKRTEDLRTRKKVLALEIDTLNRGVRILTLKKPVIVETEGECVMHDDIAPRACKEQALLKAKQNAIAIGGIRLVRSLTEVSMNDIVRDEISLKALAKIRYMEILQPPVFTAHGELGKYVTKIRAAVQSQRPETQDAVQKIVGSEGVSSIRTDETGSLQRTPNQGISAVSAFNLAYNDFLNGKYGQAVVGFQRFTKDFPGTSLTPNAHYWLGESLYNAEDYTRAATTFEYLIAEYPGSEKVPAALYRLGLATVKIGDLVKSRKYLKRVIEEFPSSDEARLAKNKLAEIR